MCEEEACVVEMRPVAKAAPASSGPVGGSVSYVLGLDAVVSGDGGVTADYVDVGRYDSIGDVSCGCDMELCDVDTVLSGTVSGGLCDLDMVSGGCDTDESGVDTVLSDAVSGGLCDLDRVAGGGDTDVSRVDTVVTGAVNGCLCDLDSVSRGVVVVRVGEMSLAGGGDTVVSGVDEPMCGDSSVASSTCVLVTAQCLIGLVIRVVLRWLMTLLRVLMTQCCLTRFVLVAGCRWLD